MTGAKAQQHSCSHHHHHHHCHHHAGDMSAGRLKVYLVLTLAFVLVEAGMGLYARSLALCSDAMHNLTIKAEVSAETWADIAIVLGATVLSLCLGAVTLRRRTA